MKTKLFVKPDLTMLFISMPLIGVWIEADFNKDNSTEDLINLVHKWYDISESTTNEVKKLWYERSANALRTELNN